MERTIILIVLAFSLGLETTPTMVCIYQAYILRINLPGSARAVLFSLVAMAFTLLCFVTVAAEWHL